MTMHHARLALRAAQLAARAEISYRVARTATATADTREKPTGFLSRESFAREMQEQACALSAEARRLSALSTESMLLA